MINKKIINARASGEYRSKLEKAAAARLLPLGFLHEPAPYVLVPKVVLGSLVRVFEGDKEDKSRTCRPVTYTPDFVLSTERYLVVVECKGYPNDVYPLKRKLFLEHVNASGIPVYFIEVKDTKHLLLVIPLIKQIIKNHENN
jgi:hypothetical protein